MNSNFELAPAEWATLRRLLDDALDQPPAERATWVDALASDYEAFKPRLRALLAHAARGTEALPLDTLPRIETAQFLADHGTDADGLHAGSGVGPYRLIRALGEGGMGEVWLADRTDILHKRQVALKLPRLLTGRAALAERMAREREILAALNHPNIARLYDAGIAADGQPYLALEYVEGERIDAYCTRRQLDVPARLRLFLQVARAVAHAHANLVVHRDLKPTNILVTGAGDVKLLDFGIAKLLEDGRARETELTQLAGRALTPDYAAPEQILGQPIGTAADVYALGVVLFELLTGSRPYQLKRDSRAALEEAIVQAEPARPSSVVTQAKLRKRLQGDLDTIVLKALKKAPEKRYGTVLALAEDLERYLDGRPVLAQADSGFYRLRKFVARNRLAVGGVGLVLFALLAGAAVALWQARIATAERNRAEEVRTFIESIFVDADPFGGSGRPLTAVELLRQARARIPGLQLSSPEVRVELLNTLAASMLNLQDTLGTEAILSEAAKEGQPLGATHLQVLRTNRLLARLKVRLGQPEEAKRILNDVVPVLQREPVQYADELLAALLARTEIENARRDYSAAEASATETLQTAERIAGDHRAEMIAALLQLSYAHNYRRRIEPAFDAARQAYELARRVFPVSGSHPVVNSARMQYAVTLWDMDEQDQAVDLMREGERDATAVFGAESPIVGEYAQRMTSYLAAAGYAREAVAASEQALRLLGPLYARDSIAYAALLDGKAVASLSAFAAADALDAATRAREIVVAVLGDAHEHAHVLQVARARALTDLGRADEASRLLTAMIESYRATGYSGVSTPMYYLGVAIRMTGDPAKALELQQQALKAVRPGPRAQRFSSRVLVEIGLNRLELQDLAGARTPLTEGLAILKEKFRMPTPARANAQLGLGRLELGEGRPARALAHLQESDAFWRALASENRAAGEAAYWLGRCYAALGRQVEAEGAYARAVNILVQSPLPSDAKLVQLARRR